MAKHTEPYSVIEKIHSLIKNKDGSSLGILLTNIPTDLYSKIGEAYILHYGTSILADIADHNIPLPLKGASKQFDVQNLEALDNLSFLEEIHTLVKMNDFEGLETFLKSYPVEVYGNIGKAYYLFYGRSLFDDISQLQLSNLSTIPALQNLDNFGVSIQELINVKPLPNVENFLLDVSITLRTGTNASGKLTLKYLRINSLDGIENINNFSNVHKLFISKNRLRSLNTLISPRLTEIHAGN